MTTEGNSALFSRPPLETLPPARDRWTPIYLEHGRVEVDDAAIKWVGADGTVCPLPVATMSAILLGPGTTVTHAAVKATAQCNCLILWVGEEAFRFYAFGVGTSHDNAMARTQATAWATAKSHNNVARKMFKPPPPRLRCPLSYYDGGSEGLGWGDLTPNTLSLK